MKTVEEAVAKIGELTAAVKAAELREAARDTEQETRATNLAASLKAVQEELAALKANSGLPDAAFAQLEEALALVNADAPAQVPAGETEVPIQP